MTSFGAKQIIEDEFMHTFKVKGQVYPGLPTFVNRKKVQKYFMSLLFNWMESVQIILYFYNVSCDFYFLENNN